MATTSLHLFKQDFKFSAAHFLIFDEARAERLHGHNYQVKVRCNISADMDYAQQGFAVDFAQLKLLIRQRLKLWDEMVLLPEKHPDMKMQIAGSNLEVKFRDRFYSFPANEVVRLSVTNTSVENLSRLLGESLRQDFERIGIMAKISSIRVYVEESAGQGAATQIAINR